MVLVSYQEVVIQEGTSEISSQMRSLSYGTVHVDVYSGPTSHHAGRSDENAEPVVAKAADALGIAAQQHVDHVLGAEHLAGAVQKLHVGLCGEVVVAVGTALELGAKAGVVLERQEEVVEVSHNVAGGGLERHHHLELVVDPLDGVILLIEVLLASELR